MRAKFIRDFETKINNGFSVRAQAFLEANPYPEIFPSVYWMLGIFKTRVQGTTTFTDFDQAIAGQVKKDLSKGDVFYSELFRSDKYINEQTKEKESKTPFTDAIRSIYEGLFMDNNSNDDKLSIYTELRAFVEKELGRQLASDATLQTYGQWLIIDELLEVQHEIMCEWRNMLPIARIRSEQAKFLNIKKRLSLAAIASLHFSFGDREKAAKAYTAQLRKLSKKNAFTYVDSAIKNADLIHFTQEISFQNSLSKRLGIKELLTFIDHLSYPIAQHHALLLVDELDDYVSIIQEICSGAPRKTSKEYLLIYTLKNYFGFVNRTLSDLEYYRNYKSYYQSKELDTITEIKLDAQRLYDEWKDRRMKQSFDAILAAIFPKSLLSSSRYFIPFFDWLNSYSKLYLTHPATSPQRELIDLFNEEFQQKLNGDDKSYHYLADQLLNGKINEEGLKKLVGVMVANPGDTSFRDKLYRSYIKHLESEDFRWHAEGNVDNMEAINHAYFFSQVICAYSDGDVKWRFLFEKHRNIHQGWLPTPLDLVRHQREAYLLSVGIGMAYYQYAHKKGNKQATSTLFGVLQLLLSQLRNDYDRSIIDYETPLWFAGATVARYAAGEKNRFIKLICSQVDSLKLFMRVVYEFLLNSQVNDLLPASLTRIRQRIQNEFFVIESSKVDTNLRKDFDYYEKMKDAILKKLSL